MAAPEVPPGRPVRRRILWFAVAAAAVLAAWAAPFPFDAQARLVLGIAVAAMVLWVSEAMPLAATAGLSSLLLILVAGLAPGRVLGAYADPVVALLLGGFALGAALQRHGLDRALAAVVLRRAGTSPRIALLAVMAVTAGFSMWISNTAATAIMLPVGLGMASAAATQHKGFRRACALGVAFAAGIGGLATPLGSTPNPLALRFLASAGQPLSFGGWMLRMAPLALLLLLAAWALLVRRFPPGGERLEMPPAPGLQERHRIGVMLVFFAAVGLWLTPSLHGVSAELVSLAALVALFAFGLLDERDLPNLGWSTLLLIGGGIAIGQAIQDVGLDGELADRLLVALRGEPFLAMALVLAATGMAFTVIASNTAAAVVLIPIALRLAEGLGADLQAVGLLAAAAVSTDFLVPVGTPPNAMAYGTGEVNTRDLLRAGAPLTLVALTLITLAAWLVW